MTISLKESSVEPRVAVVGCGYWGRNLVRNFDALGALAAICDASPTHAGDRAVSGARRMRPGA